MLEISFFHIKTTEEDVDVDDVLAEDSVVKYFHLFSLLAILLGLSSPSALVKY